MKNLFSIGEVSKIKNITVKALRYYHKMGILEPKFIDESTGYRYYSIEQFIYIDIIKGCRELGTSIAELQEIFKDCDMDKLLKFSKEKRKEAEENILKMKEIIKHIDLLNESVENSRNALNKDDIEIKYFDKRYIVVSECKESGSLKELLYYSNLNRIIETYNIDVNMDKGIIYNIKPQGIIEPSYVFSGIIDNSNIHCNDYIKVLPEGNYLILSYNKGNEDERVNKIVEYANTHNLKINSFIEFELFDDLFNTNSYSCQLQVLIDNHKKI